MLNLDFEKNRNSGFTLIELLVVISIIGLLASVVLVSLNSARTKARDAKRKADLAQLQKAIEMYYMNTDTMPGNNDPSGYMFDNHPQFLIELVNNKIISKIPHDPSSPTRRYFYYNYGPGTCAGYFLMVYLEGDSSQNPDFSSLANTTICPSGWNAAKNGDCKPGSSYCVHGTY